MRSTPYLLAASLALGVPAAALAQAPPPPPVSSAPSYVGPTDDHWLASAFVGSSFGQSSDNPNVLDDSSIEFGGQIAYLWGGVVGAEFLADFAPSFKVTTIALNNEPSLNTYMANVIAAVPFGASRQIQPFISGGFGGIQLAADVLNNPFDVNSGTTVGSHMNLGTNIGGGIIYAGAVGVRADVRYFHTSSESQVVDDVFEQVAANLLTGLSFWRANVGIAFRW
jgi:hypothetical protein